MDANFFTSIDTLLDKILNDFLNDTSQFLLVARIIAGLGLLISSYFVFFRMMDQQSDAISKYLGRFLLIFLGLFYYSTFINVINLPLKAISNSVRAITVSDDAKMTAYYEARNTKKNDTDINDPEKDEELSKYLSNDSSEDNKILSDIDNNNGYVEAAITNAISNILLSFSNLAVIILNIVRTFFLIVLSVFGIFVIALSAYPTLEGSFTQWLTKYINIYLWLPIGYLLQSILLKVQLSYVEASVDDAGAGLSIMTILISLCSIIGFATVPTLSSWMINAATQGMASKLKSKSSSALGNSSQASYSSVQAASGATSKIVSAVKPS
jgi:hypothetical protein